MKYIYSATANYHARCWATDKTDMEIKDEIRRCDERYFKPYPLDGTESANQTIERICTLIEILKERASKDSPSFYLC